MCITPSWIKAMFKKQSYTAWLSEPGLKMPAYTKRVNKSIKLFKRSTTNYTKADNTLHFYANTKLIV